MAHIGNPSGLATQNWSHGKGASGNGTCFYFPTTGLFYSIASLDADWGLIVKDDATPATPGDPGGWSDTVVDDSADLIEDGQNRSFRIALVGSNLFVASIRTEYWLRKFVWNGTYFAFDSQSSSVPWDGLGSVDNLPLDMCLLEDGRLMVCWVDDSVFAAFTGQSGGVPTLSFGSAQTIYDGTTTAAANCTCCPFVFNDSSTPENGSAVIYTIAADNAGSVTMVNHLDKDADGTWQTPITIVSSVDVGPTAGSPNIGNVSAASFVLPGDSYSTIAGTYIQSTIVSGDGYTFRRDADGTIATQLFSSNCKRGQATLYEQYNGDYGTFHFYFSDDSDGVMRIKSRTIGAKTALSSLTAITTIISKDSGGGGTTDELRQPNFLWNGRMVPGITNFLGADQESADEFWYVGHDAASEPAGGGIVRHMMAMHG